MPHEQLRNRLQALHQELHSGQELDAETRALLGDVLRDIEWLLHPEAQPGADDVSLVDRLRDTTERFETSHPKLTHAVTQLADALAGMGI